MSSLTMIGGNRGICCCVGAENGFYPKTDMVNAEQLTVFEE